jgi:Gpi18-like mannosyltransferase
MAKSDFKSLPTSFALLVPLAVIACFAVAPFASLHMDVRQFWLPWAQATDGGLHPWGMYLKQVDCNYPPAVTYLLAGAQYLQERLHLGAAGMLTWIKLPNILAYLCGAFTVRSAMRPVVGPQLARRVGLLYLCCLPLFVNAAVWAQWDALLSLGMVMAVALLLSDRPAAAGAWFGFALAVKLQAGVIAPVLVIYAVRRLGWRGLLKSSAAGLVVWLMIALPDLLGGGALGVRASYLGAVDHYPELSINAYNPWQLVFQFRLRVMHLDLYAARADNHALFLPHLIGKRIGMVMFTGYTAMLCVATWRRPSRRTLARGATLAAFAFFMLPTQIHERYAVPAAALACVAAVWGFSRLYVGLSITTAVNQIMTIVILNRKFDNQPVSTALDRLDLCCIVVFTTANIVLFVAATARFIFERRRSDPTDTQTEARLRPGDVRSHVAAID